MDSKQYNKHDSYAHLMQQTPGQSQTPQGMPTLTMLQTKHFAAGDTPAVRMRVKTEIAALINKGTNRAWVEAKAALVWAGAALPGLYVADDLAAA